MEVNKIQVLLMMYPIGDMVWFVSSSWPRAHLLLVLVTKLKTGQNSLEKPSVRSLCVSEKLLSLGFAEYYD